MATPEDCCCRYCCYCYHYCLAHITSKQVMEKYAVTVPAAFMHVRENLEELGKVANDTDLLFLKGLLDSPVVTSLVKVSLHL
ncbi:hypothetical protein HZH68_003777 [Vespula germanica]|uniref:Uncharacterized protein n=1 Tax=Vespula germanica TaxID=30212 RepID=A0A834KSL4_VESGE|nr:hypothetical protein HZH68_003777 [Vespula germanica]